MKQIQIGKLKIGEGQKIAIQSMLSTPNGNVSAAIEQALALERAGCDILRLAVPDNDALAVISALKSHTNMPIVADIHFDYKLALSAIDAGVDKVRINPGNIGAEENVRAVAEKCKKHNIPIRIGVNGGSLEKSILQKHGAPTAEALVESALFQASLIEKYDFHNIVVSMKSSDVAEMVRAYRLLAEKRDYLLHIGVTEAGPGSRGVIKNAIGIGALLLDGIGSTIRVSLTDDPVEEIYAAKQILNALNLLPGEPQLVSCPTCGRTQIDLIGLAKKVDEMLKDVHKPIKVAVMGCVVNGPGEAREADIGIAGGKGEGLLFKHGQVICKVPYNEILDRLKLEIDKL
ncbi:MAG: flavodoxin-dependent (E)-4-hydroxy-3-methylbut-2-enyl-diphosphate synthase [Clostridia bacterium]|nr:flavodoxin-dependent (E)-4-hydroxy-3-methylbut-2-enyl-diphosphate synthase [Clostridia bacterium]